MLPNDDMGKGKVTQGGSSITEDDLKKVAKDWNMDLKEVKQNMIQLLQETAEKS
jgi:hypothetical protein